MSIILEALQPDFISWFGANTKGHLYFEENKVVCTDLIPIEIILIKQKLGV